MSHSIKLVILIIASATLIREYFGRSSYLLKISLNGRYSANSLQLQNELEQNNYTTNEKRSFQIDYTNNCFLKDGKAFRYVSGSIHYFRVPPELWKDRLVKLKYCGLNVVQTYVEWSSHEPEENHYNFNDTLDIVKFISIAESLDLLVILRIGPYICAERDNGGIPSWLYKYPGIQIRTSDPTYLKIVDRWLDVLLKKLSSQFYGNGGPIIMLQIENEYLGYPSCDRKYLLHLRDYVSNYTKDSLVLFTVSRNGLECAKIPDVLATIDFNPGEDVGHAFKYLRQYQPNGPLVNTEYYPGWLDLWGSPHSVQAIEPYIKTLSDILDYNASVNLYMFHGGTSFGFGAGGLYHHNYQAMPTSYDYDALLTEGGDPTEKYFATRDLLKKYVPVPDGPPPIPGPKGNYGKVFFKQKLNLLDNLALLSPGSPVKSPSPLSFEALGANGGFVAYITLIKDIFSDPSLLAIPGLKDRGYIYVNKNYVGVLSRTDSIHQLPISLWQGDELMIIVENQGRATSLPDKKGILGDVTVGNRPLNGWTMYRLPLNTTSIINKLMDSESYSKACSPFYPTMNFFRGSLKLPKNDTGIMDTFMKMESWNKGIAWVNDFNIGRYWPHEGPQVTLYVPKSLLKPYPEENIIIILEQELNPCSKNEAACYMEFVDTPILNGSTPYHSL